LTGSRSGMPRTPVGDVLRAVRELARRGRVLRQGGRGGDRDLTLPVLPSVRTSTRVFHRGRRDA
jgi:hypothetical protein